MLDELLKEIKELQGYKHKYECQVKYKQTMSNKLYKLMTEIYEKQSYEERCDIHKKEMCNSCCYCFHCDTKDNLPEDTWRPIPSDKAWMPGHTVCEKFEWE